MSFRAHVLFGLGFWEDMAACCGLSSWLIFFMFLVKFCCFGNRVRSDCACQGGCAGWDSPSKVPFWEATSKT